MIKNYLFNSDSRIKRRIYKSFDYESGSYNPYIMECIREKVKEYKENHKITNASPSSEVDDYVLAYDYLIDILSTIFSNFKVFNMEDFEWSDLIDVFKRNGGSFYKEVFIPIMLDMLDSSYKDQIPKCVLKEIEVNK